MKKDKQLKVFFCVLIIILLLSIGLSFGYYLLNKIQENTNAVRSQCFKLEFSNEKNASSLDNMYPISDEDGRKLTPYSFTITNTCDMLAGYTVNMEMLEGTSLNSKYLDVMINNEGIKLLTNYELTDTIISGSVESRILARGTLAYNDSVDYVLRFWMDKDVTDAASMNKYFASKIVVEAAPSNWTPKDAGYKTLYDAILANEYQTTPEDAIEKISSKEIPDLSKTAPVIRWAEKSGEIIDKEYQKPANNVIDTYNKNSGTGDRTTQASNLTLNDTKLKFYKTKSFNTETGKYMLSNAVYLDPTTIDYTNDTKYYIISEDIQYDNASKKLYTSSILKGTIIYQVIGATKVTGISKWNNVTYDNITYKLEVVALTETELETDKSDKGLYQATDELGTTYYYRGNVKNNLVYFANLYWQIVRINGDGSIRIMYDGTKKGATGISQSINNKIYKFNNLGKSPAYVGYMYGNSSGTTFNEVYDNVNSSSIKTTIEDWYENNIINEGYGDYISETSGFCNDRTIYSGGDGVQTNININYGTYGRYVKNTAQFICQNMENDLYTTANSSIGNKSLKYPVGLITYDELVFAGMDSNHTNKLSWVYSTQHYWTMSPLIFNATNGVSNVWALSSSGYMLGGSVSSTYGVRPVINLKSDVKVIEGIGTINEPFVIDTD